MGKREYHTIDYSKLEKYGINPLTGEACAFSMRTLCDLNIDGITLLQDFLGLLPLDYNALNEHRYFPRNWNSSVNGKPAIASCMLSRFMLKDLYRFILYKEGWEVVVENGGDWTGMSRETWDEVKDAWPSTANVHFIYKCPEQPSVGSRNVHAMTGRAM